MVLFEYIFDIHITQYVKEIVPYLKLILCIIIVKYSDIFQITDTDLKMGCIKMVSALKFKLNFL